mmetsp:Transcript_49780/g.132002  ORF Transcript_49780/g.132002 Transcript_49780/m.132002 type:complete len:598 (-) Transcript_49780:89-1882(-)
MVEDQGDPTHPTVKGGSDGEVSDAAPFLDSRATHTVSTLENGASWDEHDTIGGIGSVPHDEGDYDDEPRSPRNGRSEPDRSPRHGTGDKEERGSADDLRARCGRSDSDSSRRARQNSPDPTNKRSPSLSPKRGFREHVGRSRSREQPEFVMGGRSEGGERSRSRGRGLGRLPDDANEAERGARRLVLARHLPEDSRNYTWVQRFPGASAIQRTRLYGRKGMRFAIFDCNTGAAAARLVDSIEGHTVDGLTLRAQALKSEERQAAHRKIEERVKQNADVEQEGNAREQWERRAPQTDRHEDRSAEDRQDHRVDRRDGRDDRDGRRNGRDERSDRRESDRARDPNGRRDIRQDDRRESRDGREGPKGGDVRRHDRRHGGVRDRGDRSDRSRDHRGGRDDRFSRTFVRGKRNGGQPFRDSRDRASRDMRHSRIVDKCAQRTRKCLSDWEDRDRSDRDRRGNRNDSEIESLRKKLKVAEGEAEARRTEAQLANVSAGEMRRRAALSQREATQRATAASLARREADAKRDEAERKMLEAKKCEELTDLVEQEEEELQRSARILQEEASQAQRAANDAQALADTAKLEAERLKSDLIRRGLRA